MLLVIKVDIDIYFRNEKMLYIFQASNKTQVLT